MQDIIDSHVHITKDGKWMSNNKDSSLQRLLYEMNLSSVKKAILIAIDGQISNDFILKIYSENKNIFIPFCSVNPSTNSFKSFAHKIRKRNFFGIKIHPRLHNFRLKDKHVIKFFKELETNLELIILLDCWFSEDDDRLLIKELNNFIDFFRELKIILAHAGGFYYDSIIPLAVKDNIFIDLSYTPTILKNYREDLFNDFFLKLKRVNSSKLLFGSDFPEVPIKESIDLLELSLNKNGFSNRDQEKIFSKNIEILLDDL